MRGTLLVFVCLSALGAKHSVACSIDRGAILPTHYELVAMADVIVVAKATAVAASGAPQVIVEVVEPLKGGGGAGPGIGARLVVDGAVNPNARRSASGDLRSSRVAGGRCFAEDYALGRHYLLLFRRDAMSLSLLRVPMLRVNEEVDPLGDPWTIAVKEYVRIAALPTQAERDTAFAALIKAGRATGASPTDKAIAADVEDHLSTPTPYKSLAQLDAMYRAATSDKKGAYLLAIANKGDPASLPLMKTSADGVVAGTLSDPYGTIATAVARYFERVPNRDVVRQLATAYFARSQDERRRWAPIFALVMRQADVSYGDLFEAAMPTATDEELERIAEWTHHYLNAEIADALHRRAGAHIAAAHAMMLHLAALGDATVVEWAMPHVVMPTQPVPEWQGMVPDWRPRRALPSDHQIAVEVIALSWHPKAAPLVARILAKGGEDLMTFIARSEGNSHPIADQNLAAIAKHPGLSPRAKAAVARAIASRAERRARAASPQLPSGH